ncbi:transposable element Tc3 transposase [Trichonephila clavipes]|nr:transposable element Tc3 transposase [Trichonephila clavipes]
MEAGWSARKVARQLGDYNFVVRRTPTRGHSRTIRSRLAKGYLGSRHPLFMLPFSPAFEGVPSTKKTGAEWIHVVFSEKFRFNLSSDDNCVGVWRLRGKRINPTFALPQHTAPTAGVMVWGAFAYNTRSTLVLIRGTMTSQRYVHNILQPHVLPLMQMLLRGIFQQDNARHHMTRVSQDCLRTVTTLPWPIRSPDLSPIEHYWNNLGRRVE